MRPYLTKNLAFTTIEMMMAVAFSVLLLTGVYGFYNTASQSYSSGISGQTLQSGANTVINKIIEGETEANIVYRLSTSETYSVANGTKTATTSYLYSCGGAAQAAACNTNDPSSELYFCQDNPNQNAPSTNCNYNDNTARWYYLNSAGTAVIYHHFLSNGQSTEETIYTAPAGSTLTLRFSPAAVNAPANVIEVDAALNANLSANITNARLAASGAASTFVLLRNHP